jgi:hypothetical protein
MRKNYDFSKATRNRYATQLRKRGRRSIEVPDQPVAPLTKSQIRRLDAQLADMRDRTRYLLVSRFGPRFALYYNVSENVYTHNDPAGATLFKRRQAAAAIRKLLGPNIENHSMPRRRQG